MSDQAATPGYGFDQDTPDQLGTAPIPVGIHSNVKLIDVAYEPAKEGSDNYCLSFYFEDSEGWQLRHWEWPIDPEEVKKRANQDGKDPNKAVQKKIQAQGVRIKHIVTKIIPKDRAVVPKVQSFKEYAQAVINLIKGALPKGPLHLKVLLSNKKYSTLPNYTPFVEIQEEGKPTSLKITPDEQKEMNKTSGNSGKLEMPGDNKEFGEEDVPF